MKCGLYHLFESYLETYPPPLPPTPSSSATSSVRKDENEMEIDVIGNEDPPLVIETGNAGKEQEGESVASPQTNEAKVKHLVMRAYGCFEKAHAADPSIPFPAFLLGRVRISPSLPPLVPFLSLIDPSLTPVVSAVACASS